LITSLDHFQVEDAAEAEDEAVDGERGEGAGAEIPDEVAHRQVAGDPGEHAGEQRLAEDALAVRAAMMIIQASLSSALRICQRLVPGTGLSRWPSEVKNPPMMRAQSRQK
jgi:hypothetical protein